VQISNDFNGDVVTWAQQKDCFYLSFNAVASGTTSVLLNVDPFLDADVNFDPNELAPGVLSQVQRGGLTYAVPMTLQPEVLWYDSTLFERAGAIAPENGWTVDEFEDALNALYSADSTGAPFSPGSNGAGYIMMLIAAYGGMPLDAVANPPGVYFTDPNNVNAIRQVLDLVRAGYIAYDSLGDYNSNPLFGQFAISDDYINALTFESQFSFDGTQDNPLRLTTYPRGTDYTPVSYAVGTGYISSTAQNPEACYRFLSQLAQRPELLAGMPVNQSILNDPAFTASQNPDALNFYQNYFETLQDPNVVYVPGNFGTGDQFPGLSIIQLWLYKAFDAYVLEDADLDTALQQAQSFTESFVQCADDLPPDNGVGATEQERITRYNAYVDCVVLVDPSLSETFGR
jgi:ABC-type glycerol-3-phosphate transport system substrate-binding protein